MAGAAKLDRWFSSLSIRVTKGKDMSYDFQKRQLIMNRVHSEPSYLFATFGKDLLRLNGKCSDNSKHRSYFGPELLWRDGRFYFLSTSLLNQLIENFKEINGPENVKTLSDFELHHSDEYLNDSVAGIACIVGSHFQVDGPSFYKYLPELYSEEELPPQLIPIPRCLTSQGFDRECERIRKSGIEYSTEWVLSRETGYRHEILDESMAAKWNNFVKEVS